MQLILINADGLEGRGLPRTLNALILLHPVEQVRRKNTLHVEVLIKRHGQWQQGDSKPVEMIAYIILAAYRKPEPELVRQFGLHGVHLDPCRDAYLITIFHDCGSEHSHEADSPIRKRAADAGAFDIDGTASLVDIVSFLYFIVLLSMQIAISSALTFIVVTKIKWKVKNIRSSLELAQNSKRG